MTEDHEQDRTEERDTTSRPVTAAARRERRASARGGTPPTKPVEDKVPATRQRRPKTTTGAKDGDGTKNGTTKTLSKEERGVATPKRDGRDKRPSAIVRLIRFLREVIGELRKVIWPTRKQQITYTIVVLVFVSIVVAFVSGLDLGFAKAVFAIFA